MLDNVIDPIYMPFTSEDMKPHFNQQADKHVAYYTSSAQRYHEFMDTVGDTRGIPLSKARGPRQIEKDERFWVATSLKHLYDSPTRVEALTRLLSEVYGQTPPIEGITTWWECLSGELHLFFETCLPAPVAYNAWLRENLESRQLIPYVLDAANRKSRRGLEGMTHADALLLNPNNGFSLIIEGKVSSDISHSVSFDDRRNQVARSIDVMLETNSSLAEPLSRRDPNRSLFALLTPDDFRLNPKSRFYGWVMNEYQTSPGSLERDLPHRKDADWVAVSRRLGWLSYEEIEFVLPGACPWIGSRLAVRAA